MNKFAKSVKEYETPSISIAAFSAEGVLTTMSDPAQTGAGKAAYEAVTRDGWNSEGSTALNAASVAMFTF